MYIKVFTTYFTATHVKVCPDIAGYRGKFSMVANILAAAEMFSVSSLCDGFSCCFVGKINSGKR